MPNLWNAAGAQVQDSIPFDDDGVGIAASNVNDALDELGGDTEDLKTWRLGMCYASLGAPAAEVGDVRTVAVALKNFDDQPFAQVMTCQAFVYDAGQLAANAAFTVEETGDGTAVDAAGASHIFTTDAGGLATLSVTDVAGASGLTVRLVVKVLNGAGPSGRDQYVAVAFDGA